MLGLFFLTPMKTPTLTTDIFMTLNPIGSKMPKANTQTVRKVYKININSKWAGWCLLFGLILCQSLGKPHVHAETVPKMMTVQPNANIIVKELGCFIIKVIAWCFSSIFTNVNIRITLMRIISNEINLTIPFPNIWHHPPLNLALSTSQTGFQKNGCLLNPAFWSTHRVYWIT